MKSYFVLIFVAVFMPVAMLAYSIVPKRLRGYVLLVFSYAFLMIMSGRPVVYLVAATLITYVTGLTMGHFQARRDAQLAEVKKGKKAIKEACKRTNRWVMVAGILLDLGMLFALNYLGFFAQVGSGLLSLFGIDKTFEPPLWIAPMGISFYTLMAVSYLVDVYRETVKPDRNLGRLALYLSFFPHIMEGPIARYSEIAQGTWEGNPINRQNLYTGFMRIAVGFAKKLIVADRLNLFVDPVFDDFSLVNGGIIALAAVLYTIPLYCDFSGCMDVAIGLGCIFNVSYPENFRQPFFSLTTSEFWQRWHITLGSWFKDYVYYPVSLSKRVKRLTTMARKRFGNKYGPLLVSSIALFCVWFLNGLWHGAGSQYLFFGMYYFVLIWLGGLIDPLARSLATKYGIDRDSKPYRLMRRVRTLLFVFVGELFFRANDLPSGLAMFKRIFTHFSLETILNGKIFNIGMDPADFIIAGIFIALVFARDYAYEHDHNLLAMISGKNAVIRWAAWIAIVMAVVIFGAYGHGYIPVDPMYAQF